MRNLVLYLKAVLSIEKNFIDIYGKIKQKQIENF